MLGRGYSQEGHDSCIHAHASEATERAAKDEHIDLVGRTTDGAAGLEQEHRHQVEDFGIKLREQFAPTVSSDIQKVHHHALEQSIGLLQQSLSSGARMHERFLQQDKDSKHDMIQREHNVPMAGNGKDQTQRQGRE